MQTLTDWAYAAYETDKIAIESEYEELMRVASEQHEVQMTALGEMRTRALERLTERYGNVFSPATAANAD